MFLEFAILLDPPPRQRQGIEQSLGATLQILRALLGADYTPISVAIPHSPLSPASDYLDYFGCTPHFAQPAAGFTLRTSDLRRRLRHHGADHDAALSALREITPDAAPSVSRSVTDLIHSLMSTGTLSVEFLAEQLQLHPRALQRLLIAEGQTYSTLVDKARRETAAHCLRDTDISLDHLTRLLGYSEHSVLTRSYRRWFGCSPTAYRLAHRQPGHT